MPRLLVEPASSGGYDRACRGRERRLAETVEPWSSLAPGDRFVVANQRGEVYEPTFIRNGPSGVGLYVRNKGVIGRLHPEHLDWTTFQRLLGGDLVVRGDQVMFEVRRGEQIEEIRGTFVEIAPAGVVVTVDSPERPTTFPLREVMSGSFRLLLATRRLRAGEEFAGFT